MRTMGRNTWTAWALKKKRGGGRTETWDSENYCVKLSGEKSEIRPFTGWDMYYTSFIYFRGRGREVAETDYHPEELINSLLG